MKRLVIYIILPVLILLLAFPAAATGAETNLFPVCDSTTTDSAICQDKDKTQTHTDNSFYGKNGVLIKVARLIATGVGVASVIMIIIGGIKFVLASGDPSNVKSAKDTIIFAIAGLVIAAFAGAIIRYVLVKL